MPAQLFIERIKRRQYRAAIGPEVKITGFGVDKNDIRWLAGNIELNYSNVC